MSSPLVMKQAESDALTHLINIIENSWRPGTVEPDIDYSTGLTTAIDFIHHREGVNVKLTARRYNLRSDNFDIYNINCSIFRPYLGFLEVVDQNLPALSRDHDNDIIKALTDCMRFLYSPYYCEYYLKLYDWQAHRVAHNHDANEDIMEQEFETAKHHLDYLIDGGSTDDTISQFVTKIITNNEHTTPLVEPQAKRQRN